MKKIKIVIGKIGKGMSYSGLFMSTLAANIHGYKVDIDVNKYLDWLFVKRWVKMKRKDKLMLVAKSLQNLEDKGFEEDFIVRYISYRTKLPMKEVQAILKEVKKLLPYIIVQKI